MVDWLASYIRAVDPSAPPHPRAPLYRRLVRNTLFSVMAEAFPVTRQVLGKERWQALYADFLASAGPRTSLYRDVPGDLVDWAIDREHDYADLLQWEWLETLAARHPADLDAIPPFDDGLIHPNPTLQVGVYHRPVQSISEQQPSPPPFAAPMAYLVWRRPRSDQCAYQREGMLVMHALAMAAELPSTGEALAARLAEQVQAPQPTVAAALRESFAELLERDGLLP